MDDLILSVKSIFSIEVDSDAYKSKIPSATLLERTFMFSSY